ncbi:dockerin type I domain-containing protein [Clostridium sp. LP20]|uniref:dockerin type I domain-containing protein n=1 Tax=Clostridium sp. LP20 TaxID=3418665 RepID=UPI003EE71CF3
MKKTIKNERKVTAITLSTLMLLGLTQPVSAATNNFTSIKSDLTTNSSITTVTGDLNGDGKVNILDMALISQAYNSRTGDTIFNSLYDLNSDGIIDIYDIVKVSSNFTVSTDTTVPAEFQISKNNWDGGPNYTITMNLWFGTNGDQWILYENGDKVASVPLVNASPGAQSASYDFKDKPNGTYEYTAELVNAIGVTKSKNTVIHEVTKNEKPIEVPLPESAAGIPALGYTVLREKDDSFEWAVYMANPNKKYIWDGMDFSAWGLSFDTDNEITSISNCASYKKDGKTVTIDLKNDERLLSYGTTKVFVVKGKKKSENKPTNIKANLIRGNIEYPKFAGLPSTWSKNKANLTINDLIANKEQYYDSTVKGNTGNKLMYTNPAHPTQMQIGMPKQMPMKINGYSNLRIWIPSEYLALGLATGTEFLGLNPSFMVGLSIKENSTCSLVPLESGENSNLTELDGKTWAWPIQKKHPDGPFQMEKGNFNEVKKQYKDYLPNTAEHDKYVTLETGDPDDPSYVHSAITSYISLTMTREFLYSIPNNKFDEFIKLSKDPWVEFVLVDNSYNRGVYGLLQRNLFTTHREGAINSTNINKDYDLSGFANHIENIQNIINEMDKETENVYDAKISWNKMEKYFDQLRLFYGNGTPTDDEWKAMKNDTKKAFDLLAKHWGGDTISYRYDFLTLLRVIEKYLPEDQHPSPSGASWIEQVVSANNQAASAPPKAAIMSREVQRFK